MKYIHIIAFILLVVGGLNWLGVGLMNSNYLEMIVGSGSSVAKVIYILVGLSAIYELFSHKSMCKVCGSKS